MVEAARNFQSARMSAFWQAAWGRLTGKSIDRLSFDEVRQRLRLDDERYIGLQEIPIDKIVGSVGRYKDFTRSFLPRTNAVRSRWQRLDSMARGAEGFPPIEVYKVGEVYFVIDGNHRVSVARQLGAKTIEAYVTELPTAGPFCGGTKPAHFMIKEGYAGFLPKNHLDEPRPASQRVLTEPARYPPSISTHPVHQ